MAEGAGVRRPSLRTSVVASVVAGLLLGAGAFALDPLPVRAALGASPAVPAPPTAATRPAGPPTAVPTSTARSASPTPTATTPTRPPSRRPSLSGPPFTSQALLQTSELLAHGWGEATELSLQEGLVKPSLLRCVRPDRLPQETVEAYGATYESRRTQATEQVVRLTSTADAKVALDRLTDQMGVCGTVEAGLRASVGTRHVPDLEGISEAVWWNVRGPAAHDPMRGVVALVRVDDRLAVLYLHSTVTDPAATTDVSPLLRQAGRRLV